MSTTEREYRALWDSGGTHVWQGTTHGAPPGADLRLLSAAERTVMRRRPPAEGQRYAGAHIAVRRVLARYLEVPPAGIRFGTKPCPWCADPDHGRPVVIGPPTALDFNLSHAGPHWALAVTTSGQVGVDVEDGRSGNPAGAASLVMSPSELAHLDGLLDDGARQAAFLRCWTRKEAVVKAIGTGITADLKALEVRPEHPGPLVVHGGEPSGGDDWLVQDLPSERGLFVALARPAGSTGPVLLRDPHAPDAAARQPGSHSVLEPFRS
ncbi:4'-phosphopantetheinyl transferase family protein [Streptomyces sp. NBC_01237]|uniref:4'-phosphopantetheinyl transferase family protein n=1 Tax=Streptomyces sp. NBC_01237 TaxID=2903790 RepID=UPI002DDB441A|nr:4'-phosphopantetheinyl transferase superfamily protein [Streptomyces sp. NBC_01237]WRZ73303.1 4'-phosphopantetheinyl transferase superfamily protein [Streptomyces sp. NBC_01237]